MTSAIANLNVQQYNHCDEQVAQDFNQFEDLDLSKKKHLASVNGLFPRYLIEQCNLDDWFTFSKVCKYDPRNDSVVFGCFENMTKKCQRSDFKWGFNNNTQWCTHRSIHPSNTLFLRINRDDQPIYVMRGIINSLTAMLIGINFIMIPDEEFKMKDPDKVLQEIKGRNIIFLIESDTAFKYLIKLAEKFQSSAAQILMQELNDHAFERVDLRDYVQKFNTLTEVLDEL